MRAKTSVKVPPRSVGSQKSEAKHAGGRKTCKDGWPIPMAMVIPDFGPFIVYGWVRPCCLSIVYEARSLGARGRNDERPDGVF